MPKSHGRKRAQRVASEALFGDETTLLIQHGEVVYRLQAWPQGGLQLTRWKEAPGSGAAASGPVVGIADLKARRQPRIPEPKPGQGR